MNLIFESDLTLISSVRFSFFVLLGLLFGYLEYTKRFQLSYSKFNSTGKFSSRNGMFIIYFFPLLTYLFGYLTADFEPVLYHKLVFFAVIVHFLKRCLEVFFVHRYSGNISIWTALLISWGYSSVAFTIHESVNKMTTPSMLNESSIVFTSIAGISIFIIAQILNLYHHILLRNLRSENKGEYKIPEGGLFKYVNCPHYLMEIIAWIGISILSKYLVVYGLTFVMASYLTARSINTTRWYREKIPNFPIERKSILPFLL